MDALTAILDFGSQYQPTMLHRLQCRRACKIRADAIAVKGLNVMTFIAIM